MAEQQNKDCFIVLFNFYRNNYSWFFTRESCLEHRSVADLYRMLVHHFDPYVHIPSDIGA